jgi:hypothetical protein
METLIAPHFFNNICADRSAGIDVIATVDVQRGLAATLRRAEDAWVRLRLKLMLARRASANAPGVPFDLSERGVERGMRPALDGRHGFKGTALGVDRELMGGVLSDVPHWTTKQVCQAPDHTPPRRNDDQIQVEPPCCARDRCNSCGVTLSSTSWPLRRQLAVQ